MRIVIVEDSVLLRAGLVRLFAEAGHSVVAELGSTDGLPAIVESERPDLVVLDVRLPPSFGDEGVRAAVHLVEQGFEVPILLLSQHVERRHAVDLLGRSGHGVGYFLKDRVLDVGEFLVNIARVAAGENVVDPVVVRQLFSSVRDPLERLTPREREVLGLMAEGRSNGAIADELVVSAGAVEKHISSIFVKLDLPPEDGAAHRRVRAVLMWLDGRTAAA